MHAMLFFEKVQKLASRGLDTKIKPSQSNTKTSLQELDGYYNRHINNGSSLHANHRCLTRIEVMFIVLIKSFSTVVLAYASGWSWASCGT
jgi:hypothetical protein